MQSVTADQAGKNRFLEYHNTLYYGLTINPVNGDVYIADIDYVQNGVVRASAELRVARHFYRRHHSGSFLLEIKIIGLGKTLWHSF